MPSRDRTSGGLRVVGGEARGRPLLTPRGRGLRPTTALVRRALFDIVGAEVVGAVVVDAYAGVGGIGLEALSRGAARVTFVERERVPLQCLRANIERLGYGERATVVAAAVRPWLAHHPLAGTDLLICDPPYGDWAHLEAAAGGPPAPDGPAGLLQAIADNLGRAGEPRGRGGGPLVVLEHHRLARLPAAVGTLACTRAARYGTTVLSFYRSTS